ncbi:MAG TPA: hypothetical protein VFK02_03605, partial [Kofleriaceae bacterium]|nr:hypothetical protein [Kofleriaceae bacterium]
MRHATRFTAVAAFAGLAGSGCVDGFGGSNIQVDLSPATPVQAPVMGMGGPTDLPAASHFAIYGIRQGADGDQLLELDRFEIHRIVDPTSPCFIDVGDPHPGLHVTQYANKIAEDTGITDIANPPPGASEEDK